MYILGNLKVPIRYVPTYPHCTQQHFTWSISGALPWWRIKSNLSWCLLMMIRNAVENGWCLTAVQGLQIGTYMQENVTRTHSNKVIYGNTSGLSVARLKNPNATRDKFQCSTRCRKILNLFSKNKTRHTLRKILQSWNTLSSSLSSALLMNPSN